MIDANILSALSAGGDLATIALIYVIWRLDRRLLQIETTIQIRGIRHDEKDH